MPVREQVDTGLEGRKADMRLQTLLEIPPNFYLVHRWYRAPFSCCALAGQVSACCDSLVSCLPGLSYVSD